MSINTLFDIVQSNISIIIVIIFAAVPLLIGSAAATKSVSTVSDFFLCGRSLKTVPAFLTLYATWWSSFAFLGSISSFYSNGPAYWIALGWNVLFGLIFMILGKQLWQDASLNNYKTPIDMFSARYKSNALDHIVLTIMILFSTPYILIQFMGGGIIIEMATKGIISWKLSTLIFLTVMCIYIWSGGLRAVVWTDSLYAIMIITGMLLIGVIFINMTGGIRDTFAKISELSPSSLKLPKTVNGINGYGFWISMLFLMPMGEIMMPQIWTRTYAIKEEKTFYIMPFLLSLATAAYIGTMLAGNSAIILLPGHTASSDYIMPELLIKYVPSYLMSIIMCCAAAACLSTANSQLHSISQLITLDIYKRHINKRATEKRMVFVAKTNIILFAIASYIVLLYVSGFSIIQTGYLSFCGMIQLIVPVIGGLHWKKSDSQGAIAGILAGVGFSILFTVWHPVTYYISPGLIGLMINAAVFTLVSLKTCRKPAGEQ